MSEPARDPARAPESSEQQRDPVSSGSDRNYPLPESPDTDVPPSADEAPTATAAPPPEGPDARVAAPAMDGALGAPGGAAEAPEQPGVPAAEAAPPPDAAATTAPESTAVATAGAPATTAQAVAKPSRRPAVLGAMRRVLTFVLVVALFVGGVALGTRAFQMARPGSPVAEALDPVTEPPPVAQEFIRALAANDMDGVRSSLEAQQHQDITQELEKFGIHRVDRVEVLGTEVDGPRSATAVMMLAENSDGVPFGVNLVILVDGGKIEGFR